MNDQGSKNMINFEAFCWNISSSINLLFLKSGTMATEELLGGGLDIEGWNYLKNERQNKINDITDRSLILRSTFPLVMKTKFAKKEGREALDMVSAIMEQKSTIDPPWIGKNVLIRNPNPKYENGF